MLPGTNFCLCCHDSFFSCDLSRGIFKTEFPRRQYPKLCISNLFPPDVWAGESVTHPLNSFRFFATFSYFNTWYEWWSIHSPALAWVFFNNKIQKLAAVAVLIQYIVFVSTEVRNQDTNRSSSMLRDLHSALQWHFIAQVKLYFKKISVNRVENVNANSNYAYRGIKILSIIYGKQSRWHCRNPNPWL